MVLSKLYNRIFPPVSNEIFIEKGGDLAAFNSFFGTYFKKSTLRHILYCLSLGDRIIHLSTSHCLRGQSHVLHDALNFGEEPEGFYDALEATGLTVAFLGNGCGEMELIEIGYLNKK